MGRLWIRLRKQNPAGFAQMLKKNWKRSQGTQLSTSSSKAMDAMAAAHLFTESLNSNVKLSVNVGDEDSTTAAHIKEKVLYPVEKITNYKLERYYGASARASYDFQVACGTSQAKLGYQYISQTLESLHIEPGIHCISYIERMDHKATQDKLRKKKAQLRKQKLNLDCKKQIQEGNTHQSGIGLNLDPNNSTKLIQEFDIINLDISSRELKTFETCTPELTIIPMAEKFPYDKQCLQFHHLHY
ncbi:hypothetical protein pdam_00000425 [Pocillopora damicornis]|uniref:Mutator-like transposase domain-containing protein n=1 Tax=Pocillopora damicornis TaxID=46731 RepID=A0A3M6UJ88_POCDA|nr:hypothetical protein pdam_00000425 [Pocillopora damicornis]